MNLQLSKGTSVSKAHKNFKERKNKSKLLIYEKKEKNPKMIYTKPIC